VKNNFAIKGSVQRKLRWVEYCANLWVLVLNRGAGNYLLSLLSLHVVLNVFLFLFSKAKLVDYFRTNWQRAVNGFSQFTNSFVSLRQRQYYWCRDFYFAKRQSVANKKKSVKLSYWRFEFTPLRLLEENNLERQ
jgi:hypothetical protein